MSSLDELAKIDLQKLQFDATTDQTIEKSYQINYLGKQHAVRVYFELQSTSKSEEEQQQQEYLTIDISVSSIPIKQKCFSCFPSIPLAYYEILGYSQNSKTIKAGTAEPKVLYQSEITRLPSQDPVWMPTQKLNKLHLQPYFRVNVYNSADHAKSRSQLIGGCNIDYDMVVQGKEFMFEMDGLENTHVLIDRIQMITQQ